MLKHLMAIFVLLATSTSLIVIQDGGNCTRLCFQDVIRKVHKFKEDTDATLYLERKKKNKRFQ